MSTPSLLEKLSTEELATFEALCRTVDVAASEVVLEEGSPARALALVRGGELSIRVGGVEVADRPEGTWFGEFGWLVGGRATATVRARVPSRVSWFDAAALDALAARHPRAAAHILACVTEQVALRISAADLRAGEPPQAVLSALWGRVTKTVGRVFGAAPPALAEAPSAGELATLTGWPLEVAVCLAPLIQVVRFSDGEFVVRQGDSAALSDSVWLFAEGFGLVIRAEESVRMLGRGDWCGLIAWSIGGARTATVRAAGPLRALAIAFATIEDLRQSNPPLHVALLKHFAAQLATDAALFNARLTPSHDEPLPARSDVVELTSYGGWQSCKALRRVVHTADQIREVLRETAGRTLTLRAGGLSFDAQSLGSGVIVTLADFQEVRLDPATGQLRVGAAARWGDVVAALEGTGRMPPVVVSASVATVGGTLSANSMSRFTPIWGKEGRSVRSLQILCADGEIRSCSRSENEDLFYAAVGGWGSMGIVLGATYQLKRVPVPTRVLTRVERRADLDGLAEILKPSASGDAPKDDDGDDDGADAAESAYAVIAFSGGKPRVLLARASYSSEAIDPMLPHRPASRMRVPIEWAINRFSSAGQAFWNYAYDVYVREDRPYVDDLRGFTFFQDGNVRCRDSAARIGLPFRLIQQVFVIPDGRPGLLERFIAESEERLRAGGFHTALVDTLYLPHDEPFCLSSTRDGGGYAVTITYEGPVDFPRLAGELERLSVDLAAEGGRVHLVKNVFAPPALMAKSYEKGLSAWRRAKDRWDPENRFSNDFLGRLFQA